MVALRIEEIKPFTAKLFIGETFDHFLVREADVTTFNSFCIDGHIRNGYYSDEELEENKIEELSSWKVLKPICFSLIKGKKLPGSFQMIFQLSPDMVEQFLTKRGIQMSQESIQGLCLNIRYEENQLTCITATSINFFTLDKSLEREWDDEVRSFLREQGIVYIEE